ncbi:ORF6C domain-containing protein [[Clostridium] innocuum]|nr:ORF6C domain-containing protein [[Clostridium] innocuum]
MKNVMNTTNQTPIEIALGIDENGMTTARKLYEFLELHPSAFARWAKQNIENNEFFEENTDWWGFNIVLNGNECKDYKLTTDLAKHLSMESHSIRGKEARDYYVTIENKSKEAAIQLSGLSAEMQALLMHDKKLVEQDKRIAVLENNTSLDTRQRRKIRNAIHSAVASACGGIKTVAYKENSKRVYKAVYNFLYDYYDISEYADIPKVKCSEALSLIEKWYPNYDLQLSIDLSNNCKQQEMDLDED